MAAVAAPSRPPTPRQRHSGYVGRLVLAPGPVPFSCWAGLLRAAGPCSFKPISDQNVIYPLTKQERKREATSKTKIVRTQQNSNANKSKTKKKHKPEKGKANSPIESKTKIETTDIEPSKQTKAGPKTYPTHNTHTNNGNKEQRTDRRSARLRQPSFFLAMSKPKTTFSVNNE